MILVIPNGFVSSSGAYLHRDDYIPRINSYAFLLLSDTVIGYFILADLIEKFNQIQVIGLLPHFYY